MNFWDGKELFKELPFYNTFIEKPRIKHLKNIDLLHELLFCDELSQFKLYLHLLALFFAKDYAFMKRSCPRFGEIIKFSNRSIQNLL